MRQFIPVFLLAGLIGNTQSASIQRTFGPRAIVTRNALSAFQEKVMVDRGNDLHLDSRLPFTERIARLVDENPEFYQITSNEMQLESFSKNGPLAILIYRQLVNQIPVYQSRIDFRVRGSDQLIMTGKTIFPNLVLDTNPIIPGDVALDLAKAETEFIAGNLDNVVQNPILYIYSETNEMIRHRLAWQIKLQIHHRIPQQFDRAVSFYEIWIDARTGEMFFIKDRAENLEISGNISGMVKDVPYGTATLRPLPYMRVYVAGVGETFTDTAGYYSIEAGTTPRDVTVQFYGTFLDVNAQNASDAIVTANVTPGDTFNVLFDDINALSSERDTYFHANLVHDWVTALDNDFTGVDYIMPAKVNIGSEDPWWPCNAYWDGTGINMFSAGGGCSDTGEMADVVYHEYQHGITQFMYSPFSAPYESGMGEGFSDYTGMTIRNTPCLGDAFFGTPGGCLRDGENTRQFPGSECGGEPHCLGEISMGALWKMRQNLIESWGDSASAVAHSDTLFRFAMAGRPYTIPDLLTEILIVDDNDGTLLNGTPNFIAITEAFGQHNVYSDIPEFGIAHTPIENTGMSYDPILVEAIISSVHGAITIAELHYDVMGVSSVLEMQPVGNGYYRTWIPVQPAGSVVKYYILAEDAAGNQMASPASAPAITNFFLIGNLDMFPAIVEDDGESEQGWTLGLAGDNASSGIWILDDPIGTFENGLPVQPENDHTEDGTQCYVTGNAAFDGTNAGDNDVDGGVTTLLSPAYDLSGVLQPVLTYWRWYSNNTGANPGSDTWLVQITADGSNWVSLEETTDSDTTWVYKQFLVEQYITPSTTVQLRFIASDDTDGSLVEAAVDDIKILTGISLDVIPGDMDFSDNLDIFDILAMTDALLSVPGPNGIQTYVGDLNQDGILNIIDMIFLINMVVYP